MRQEALLISFSLFMVTPLFASDGVHEAESTPHLVISLKHIHTDLSFYLGDGDVMMRVLPSLLAVEYMRVGSTPLQAAQQVQLY